MAETRLTLISESRPNQIFLSLQQHSSKLTNFAIFDEFTFCIHSRYSNAFSQQFFITNGIVCIDSKFPLDNYREMLKSTDDAQKQSYGAGFCKDVEGHIAKINADYVKPEDGTTPFAFGFSPSETVYQFLTECHPNVVADAAKEGVLVVSPATLAINLNLLTVGLRATEIAENAQQIQNNITKLSKSLNEVEESWNTLYSHITKAYNKASEVNDKHNRLRNNFDQITEQKEEP